MSDEKLMADEVRAVVREAVLLVLGDQSATVVRNDWALRLDAVERILALEFCADTAAARVAEKLSGRVVVSDDGHQWIPHKRDGWSACSRCGMVRNYVSVQACSGKSRIAKVELERDAALASRSEVASALSAERGRISALESQLAALSTALDQARQDTAVMAVRVPRETSASIAAWADETFGKPESNMSIWQRAAKEFEELRLKLLADDNHQDAAEECADVCIVLDRLVHRLGKDMAQGRDRKMEINRARKWTTTGDGHGQHVDDGGDQ